MLLTLGGGMFCLLAIALIPSSATIGADATHGLMVIPWGKVISPAAPSLIVAGMAMVAALLFAASFHYARATRWLRAGVAVVGLAALAGAWISYFATVLFPEIMVMPMEQEGQGRALIWLSLAYAAAGPMTVLGLLVLAAPIVVRPVGRPRGGLSGTAALAAGAVILAGALVALFAPQLFPNSLNTQIVHFKDMSYSPQPWPLIISVAGAPLALAGALVFLFGVLVTATTRRVHAEEFPEAAEK